MHFSRDYLSQLAVYGFLGLFGTACHYLTLYLLVELGSLSVLAATSVGFVVGALVNHELNRRYLFHHTERSYRDSATRFFVVAAFGFLVNLLAMYVLTNLLMAHYILSQLFATGVVFLMTFIFNKLWTFQA